MSELRERVEKLVALLGGPQLGIERAIFIERIEAFAKEQQIKGMEAVKMILQAHHSRVWITEQIDAAIKQLKEGS